MIRKKITTVPRSPRVSQGVRVEGSSSPNQQYLASGEHFPDRTLAPIVLQPYISYTDGTTGKHVDNALPEVTNGCWYRLTPSNKNLGICAATTISMSDTGTDANGNTITVFSVVSTPGSDNYGRLTVRENIPPGEDITYVFTGVLSTDGSRIEARFNSRCDIISEVPDIEFDNNPTALFDPLHGEQYYTINPKLTIDLPVVWKWKSYHELEGGLVDLCSTQLDWCIEKVGNGIRIDRKRMPDAISLVCVAEVTVDGTQISIERPVTHTRMMPSFEYDLTRVGDITEDVDTICPYAEIKTAGELVTDLTELAALWFDSSKRLITEGLNPTIPLSRIPDGIIDLVVLDRGGFAALIDDGKLIMDGNALIITRSKDLKYPT